MHMYTCCPLAGCATAIFLRVSALCNGKHAEASVSAVALQMALQHLQPQQGTLDMVLVIHSAQSQDFKKLGSSSSRACKTLAAAVQRRFVTCDQPVLLLVYFLNPARPNNLLEMGCDLVDSVDLLLEMWHEQFYPKEESLLAVKEQFAKCCCRDTPHSTGKLFAQSHVLLASTPLHCPYVKLQP